jgi:hypothetical protein
MVVDERTGNPGVGKFHLVPGKNHFNICKPKNREDFVYTKLLEFVERVTRRHS